ncbi:hypothetical protein PQO01_08620 [Lentisphaera marina]|uniref:hypothetical protein n=1 Tax=Lentisphaera marina TaxID=1111041 RepID=UPI002365E4FE|nr:hypothetical protein [Lentisphaera marina]MDD7985008.1 hypothetical protein [Lentisphaera marina]
MKIYKVIMALFGCGFGKDKPKTKRGLILRRLEKTANVLSLLYLLLLLFPNTIFANEKTFGNITIYSNNEIPDGVDQYIKKVNEKISKSFYYDQSKKYDIYLCNNEKLYFLFAPLSVGSFAATNLANNIFIANADFKNNISTAYREKNNLRSLESVIAHEINHVMMNRELSLIQNLKTPKWIKEGYSEFVAQESSFSEKDGLEALIKGLDINSKSYDYFVYRKLIEYLITVEKKSINDLINTSESIPVIKERLIAHYTNL